ncbi:MAG: hypothetical protein LAP40_18935 [Acidobacteriia bacterium]|nr:hypothetical protein [Terriglobia bacterium]
MKITQKSALEGIAFQTNLLGLSASVEAASEGGNEAGFATAAAELQHLARAAKKTASLLEESAPQVPPPAGASGP